MRETDLGSLDLREFVRAGDTVLVGPGTAEPTALVEALLAQRGGLGGISVLLGTSYSGTIRPEHADHIAFSAFGVTGGARRLADAGLLDIVPVHMSQVPQLIRSGLLHVDVVLAQLAEGPSGLSFGAADLYLGPALACARTVIAELNDHAPWTYARTPPDTSRIAVAVRTSRPLPAAPAGEANDADIAVARHVAGLIPDGSVLQVGVGGLFQALGGALSGHRDLGIHSGTVGDMLVDLVEGGVVTNARKSVDAGVSVVATLLGSRRLLDFANENAAVRVDDAGYVHSLETLARLEGLVCVNSAIEVDLTGQVNSELAGNSYLGSIGGQVDFMRGAQLAPRGRSIVALRASGRKAGSSRIVESLSNGITTTARSDVDCVVTEHGVAHLRGKSIRQRIDAMIGIAPPEARGALEEAGARIAGVARHPVSQRP